MDFTYFNAVYTVQNALSKVKDEKGMKRMEKFLKTGPCPDSRGSRYSKVTYGIRRKNGEGASLLSALPMTSATIQKALQGCSSDLIALGEDLNITMSMERNIAQQKSSIMT